MQERSRRLCTTNDLCEGNPETNEKPLLPFSKEKLRQLINAGEFPPPLKIGSRNYWYSTTVENWIENLAKNADGGAK